MSAAVGRRAALLAIAGGLVLPAAPASAHGIISLDAGALVFSGDEATSRDTLEVRRVGEDLRVRDVTSDGGIDPGPCRATGVDDTGAIVEARCPRAGISSLRVDLGGREDRATFATLSLPVDVRGGEGADTITTGRGADTLDGGTGDDVLSAGDGADVLLARDGRADRVRCGAGEDRVSADQLDVVAADCETVERVTVTPDGTPGADATPPPLAAAPVARRVRATRGAVEVRVNAGEPGTIAVAGTLTAGARTRKLKVLRADAVPSRQAKLRLDLTVAQLRAARAALRRGRRVHVRLRVVATDAAGNTTEVALPAIRLV